MGLLIPEQALLAAIENSSEPMVWGKDDCGLWVADIVKAVTGHDPAAEIRDRYTTERGALRIYRKAGGTMAVLNRAGWGRVETPENLDIGLIEGRPFMAATVFINGLFHARGPCGVTHLQPDQISEIYRCPR